MTQSGPLDQRLARVLIKPLGSTPVHPNHLTTVSLLFGIAAALMFAFGGTEMNALAALMFVLAVFMDHTDGELARLTGKTSDFGHNYDFIVGGINYTLLFISIGYGLWQQTGESWPLVLGLLAGLSNPVIMSTRMLMQVKFGFEAVDHPSDSSGMFNVEDFIYLIGPIVWFSNIWYFFVPYGLGTLGYLGWTIYEYFKWQKKTQA